MRVQTGQSYFSGLVSETNSQVKTVAAVATATMRREAEPGLDVGDEKIHPIEAVAALPRCRRMQRTARLPIAGNGVVETRPRAFADACGHRDGNGRIETAVPEWTVPGPFWRQATR